jgi:5-formyltetrahydrofolate cyclo-ligase
MDRSGQEISVSALKAALRKRIAAQKQLYTEEDRLKGSLSIKARIESLDVFRQARTVLLYYSLPDEVQTLPMLAEWISRKRCLLPQVQGSNLTVREYLPGNSLQTGYMGIPESTGNIFPDLDRIDLIIVPGIAFDAKKNRLGRGKGYYDRLLSHAKAVKAGICYDFQLVEKVPVSACDVPMDCVITPTEQYH